MENLIFVLSDNQNLMHFIFEHMKIYNFFHSMYFFAYN